MQIDNAAKLKRIFNHYGAENQKRKLQEECAELIRAIARQDETNFIEETADVLILIHQFCADNGQFAELIGGMINGKIERTLNGINAEKSPCLAVDCLGCTCLDDECRMKN